MLPLVGVSILIPTLQVRYPSWLFSDEKEAPDLEAAKFMEFLLDDAPTGVRRFCICNDVKFS